MPQGKHNLPKTASHSCIAAGKHSLHTESMQTIGELLKKARTGRGMSQDSLGQALGVSRQAVGQWESGTTAPTLENLVAAFSVLGADLPEAIRAAAETTHPELLRRLPSVDRPVKPNRKVFRGTGPIVETQHHVVRDFSGPRPFGDLPNDVPVVKTVAAEGYFLMNGDVVDSVRRPPGALGTSSLYAFYVVGDAMSPRYDDGDLVYVNEAKPPKPGDYVVAETSDGHCWLKRLAQRSGDVLVVEQFNPPSRVELKVQDMSRLHRVVPWNELLGI